MNDLSEIEVKQLLASVKDPNNDIDLITSKVVKSVQVSDSKIALAIELGYPAKSTIADLKQRILQDLQSISGARAVDIDIQVKILAHGVQQALKPLPGVKNIIAVASGKGGVGKSTTAVNLALALAVEGASVGILDADIYGPSIPTMLGVSGLPESEDQKTMRPKMAYGIQANSIGFLVDPDQAIIWRGPMVTGALQQLLKDTRWQDLDYLIIDLPPGTGDIQLTLAQQIPVSGAVIVTTPQDIALIDAQRALAMFEKVNIPVLGVIENMSLHICTQCGHAEAIFGAGGGQAMAEKNKVALLGALPLDASIRTHADSGRPTVMQDPQSQAAMLYRSIARKMTAKLALRTKDYKSRFPVIKVENI